MTAPLFCAVCEHSHADVPGLVLARWQDQTICTDCLENRPGREEAEAEACPVPTDAAYIAWAKDEYVCDDIEIDPDTRVSLCEGGAWVLAWVHVYDRRAHEG